MLRTALALRHVRRTMFRTATRPLLASIGHPGAAVEARLAAGVQQNLARCFSDDPAVAKIKEEMRARNEAAREKKRKERERREAKLRKLEHPYYDHTGQHDITINEKDIVDAIADKDFDWTMADEDAAGPSFGRVDLHHTKRSPDFVLNRAREDRWGSPGKEVLEKRAVTEQYVKDNEIDMREAAYVLERSDAEIMSDMTPFREPMGLGDEDNPDQVLHPEFEHNREWFKFDRVMTMHYVMRVRRVSRRTGRGKHHSFMCMGIIGSGEGLAGFGIGRAAERQFVKGRALAAARKNLLYVPRAGGRSIMSPVMGVHNRTRAYIWPTSPHSGVRGNKIAQAIMSAFGIDDVTIKIHGNRNPYTCVYAIFNALSQVRDMDMVARERGLKVDYDREMYPLHPNRKWNEEYNADAMEEVSKRLYDIYRHSMAMRYKIRKEYPFDPKNFGINIEEVRRHGPDTEVREEDLTLSDVFYDVQRRIPGLKDAFDAAPRTWLRETEVAERQAMQNAQDFADRFFDPSMHTPDEAESAKQALYVERLEKELEKNGDMARFMEAYALRKKAEKVRRSMQYLLRKRYDWTHEGNLIPRMGDHYTVDADDEKFRELDLMLVKPEYQYLMANAHELHSKYEPDVNPAQEPPEKWAKSMYGHGPDDGLNLDRLMSDEMFHAVRKHTGVDFKKRFYEDKEFVLGRDGGIPSFSVEEYKEMEELAKRFGDSTREGRMISGFLEFSKDVAMGTVKTGSQIQAEHDAELDKRVEDLMETTEDM